MRYTSSIFMALAVAVATPTAAQDLFAGAFNGPYGGIFLGYSDYDADIDQPGFNEIPYNIDGAEYGIYIGYGQAFGQFYVAGEAEIGRGPESTNIEDIAGNDFDVETTWGVSAIGGYLVAPTVLVYGRLGYQQATVNDAFFDVDEDINGARFGAGFEVAVVENVRIRGEYVYTDYSSQEIAGFEYDAEQSLFRFGVAYEF